MNETYIFGGYLFTGGKLDNGNPWQGINVLLGIVNDSNSTPMKGEIAKARRSDELVRKLSGLTIGQPCKCYFDLHGRLVEIMPLAKR